MALKTSKDNTNVVLLVFERVKPKDPAGKDTGTR
jgi:hypothetical protein